MKCPACQHEVTPGILFCPECGARLADGADAPLAVLQERYELVRKLGQGGMGSVYLARDRRLSTVQWAIKEMSDAAITSPLDRERASEAFKAEAELLARLSHPNLPRVTDHFSQDGKNYLVMELVPGDTLLAYAYREGLPRPLPQALAWAGQLCQVLEYLHRRTPPVIFRDLKPTNVMITPEGTLKLIDFGIARLFKPGQNKDTQAYGTMGYSAPEQYGRGQTDARSDIYSLGVLLHYLLTGHDPARTPFHLPPALQLNPQLPPVIAEALARATENDPERRFLDIAAFRAALSTPAGPATIRVNPAAPSLAVPLAAPPVSTPIANDAFAAGAGVVSLPPPPGLQPTGRPHADTTGLARSSLWVGAVGLTLVVIATIIGIAARTTTSENLGFMAALVGSPGLLTAITAPILGFIALARSETAATVRGRRHAILGAAFGVGTLPLCCATLLMYGSVVSPS